MPDPRLYKRVSPVFDVDKFLSLLTQYNFHHQNYHILDPGLRQGVDLGYTGPMSSSQHPNLPSAHSRPHIMATLVQKEVEKGRFLGPYAEPPLEPIRINPIGFVPKSTKNEFRMITDLSKPTGSSVNFFIPKEFSSVKYPSIQDAIDVILHLKSQGHEPVLFKMDIKHIMPGSGNQIVPNLFYF